MKFKTNSWLFYLTILIQLHLDLFFVNIGLQSLLCTIMFLLAYTKQRRPYAILSTTFLFLIEKFILLHKLGLDILLILFTIFLSKILKKNIVFKSFVYYLLIVIYSFLHSCITNFYFFKTPFILHDFLIQIGVNLLCAGVIRFVYKEDT